jgi:hypothetical protein
MQSRRERQKIWIMKVAILLFTAALIAPLVGFERVMGQPWPGQSVQQTARVAENDRTKVAEGEYAIVEEKNGGAVGPFGEEIYDFHETWALWRVPGERYEIAGERRYNSPEDVPVSYKFEAQLSRDLTVLRVTEFAQLKWRKDSGPLTCDFLRTELRCSSGARNPNQSIEIRVPSDRPFGLLWPISVFSISGIARQAERDPDHPTPIRLISITQPSADRPIGQEILDGQLQYLGEEDLQAAGVKWEAHKFSIQAPLHPRFLLWTSAKGLLLALTAAHDHPNWASEGLRLVRFQQFADF